jgi:UDP-glucose 4-epimerase
MDKILVTGGAGYIGSHTCVELLAAGYGVVIVDNLANSKLAVIDRIQAISGKTVDFHCVDLLDQDALAKVFADHKIQAVVHFAGVKAVGESVSNPLLYYRNNVGGTVNLLEIMGQQDVRNLVFSSSATVYGKAEKIPIVEDCRLEALNPYGETKIIIERILADLYQSDESWNIISLRYFNPGGAHQSGLIGEDPSGIPNNLLPYVTQVATGKFKYLTINGSDYHTDDGTCVRDYVHVVDLAEGHIAALQKINSSPGLHTFNLGTGQGYSVLELVNAFEQANAVKIPCRMGPRRAGDIDICFADPGLANRELGWQARRGIADICRDAWRWQQANPQGYPA